MLGVVSSGTGGHATVARPSSSTSVGLGPSGASARMSDRLRPSATGKGYNRLANSSHNDTDAIEMPNTPGGRGRFTIDDE